MHGAWVGVDAVQIEVHDAQSGGRRYDFVGFDKLRPQMFLLISVERAAIY